MCQHETQHHQKYGGQDAFVTLVVQKWHDNSQNRQQLDTDDVQIGVGASHRQTIAENHHGNRAKRQGLPPIPHRSTGRHPVRGVLFRHRRFGR